MCKTEINKSSAGIKQKVNQQQNNIDSMSLVKRYANARATMKNYAKSYDFKKQSK